MRRLQALYRVGAIGPEEIRSRVQALLAHARHGHTRTLCRRVLAELSFTRGGDGSPRRPLSSAP